MIRQLGKSLAIFLSIIAIGIILFIGFVLISIYGTKSHKTEHFTYYCQHGGGRMDGYFCEAEIAHPYYLMSSEFSNRELYIGYKTEFGSERIIPTGLDRSGKHIVAVGINETYLLAQTANSEFYLLKIDRDRQNNIKILTQSELETLNTLNALPTLLPVFDSSMP